MPATRNTLSERNGSMQGLGILTIGAAGSMASFSLAQAGIPETADWLGNASPTVLLGAFVGLSVFGIRMLWKELLKRNEELARITKEQAEAAVRQAEATTKLAAAVDAGVAVDARIEHAITGCTLAQKAALKAEGD